MPVECGEAVGFSSDLNRLPWQTSCDVCHRLPKDSERAAVLPGEARRFDECVER